MKTKNTIKKYGLWLFALLVGAGCLLWMSNQVSISDIKAILNRLSGWQLVIWLSLNLAILFLIAFRWWWISRQMEVEIPFFSMFNYRLAASAVSYFSPGAHIGGEPVQVMALHRCHHISLSSGSLTVLLDKSFDFLLNFFAMGAGIAAIFLVLPSINNAAISAILALFGGMLVFGYLSCLVFFPKLFPQQNFARKMLSLLPSRWQKKAADFTNHFVAEFKAIHGKRNYLIGSGLLISAFCWLLLLLEFLLLLLFLAENVTIIQGLLAFAFLRAANWLPAPAGVGVLESSQAIAFYLAGIDITIAAAFIIMIRLRDFMISGAGLFIGYKLLIFGHNRRESPRAATFH